MTTIESKPQKKPTTKELVKFVKSFVFHKDYLSYMKEVVYRIYLYDEIVKLRDKIQVVRKF